VVVPYYDERGGLNLNQRFYRESVGWKDLSHPYVQPFLGASETLFIISPWLPNGDIVKYIGSRRDPDLVLLVSDHRSSWNELPENPVLGSLHKRRVVSNTYIHKVSYMVASLR